MEDTVTSQQASEKIDGAIEIIKAVGLPRGQHNERSALALLALLDIKPAGRWDELQRPLLGVTQIMTFCREYYGREYAPNTRETFRRQTIHQFVQAGIALRNPDAPGRPVNSPRTAYQVSEESVAVISTFGSEKWEAALSQYLEERETLAAKWAQHREMQMVPVKLPDDADLRLTPGRHSELIRQVISEFAPRFLPGSEVIYVGDTGDKAAYFQEQRLAELGTTVDEHGKMPDVVFYSEERNWLTIVESVTSHGPVDPKRHDELAELFSGARPALVFVTAFPDRSAMARRLGEISWETEVWCADEPTHLVHFDGEKFLGPYEK